MSGGTWNDVRVLAWIGDLASAITRYGVAIEWSADDPHLFDVEGPGEVLTWFDYAIGEPAACGFWVWEGTVTWEPPGGAPEAEWHCYAVGAWRSARGVEVWAAQANARAKAASSAGGAS